MNNKKERTQDGDVETTEILITLMQSGPIVYLGQRITKHQNYQILI